MSYGQDKKVVRSYCQSTEFWYVHTVTLTFELWLLVKVMPYSWLMCNYCVKYPDPVRSNDPGKDFVYVYIVTLTILLQDKYIPLGAWVMDSNCVK